MELARKVPLRQGYGGHHPSLVLLILQACHPKLVSKANERRMVEAGGVEPPSGNIPLRLLHTYPDI